MVSAPGVDAAQRLIHHDAVNHRSRARRGARLVALTSGGAIPDNADYRVLLEPGETLLEQSMKTSQSRAWPVIFSSSAMPPGESCKSIPARFAWKMPMGSHPGFRFGWVRRRDAPPNCRVRSRNCAWMRRTKMQRKRFEQNKSAKSQERLLADWLKDEPGLSVRRPVQLGGLFRRDLPGTGRYSISAQARDGTLL